MVPLGQSRNGELYHEPKDETKSQTKQEFDRYDRRTLKVRRFMIHPIHPRIAHRFKKMNSRCPRRSKCRKVSRSYGGRSSVGRASGCDPEGRGFKSRRSPFLVKCVALQFDPVWENPNQSRGLIVDMLQRAGDVRGALVVLPEMAESGFTNNPERVADGKSELFACEQSKKYGCYLQHGFAQARGDSFVNMVAIASPQGNVIARYAKTHLFSPTKEHQHYQAGDSVTVARLADSSSASLSVAPMICYDLRFPEVWRHAALAGAELFTLSACWPAPRADHRRALCIARAIENQAVVVACNRVGNEPNTSYAGESFILSHTGHVLAVAGDTTEILTATIDMNEVRAWRAKFPALRDMRRELLGHCTIKDC